jgi:branched-chain amino acid transport system permease protein
LLTPSFLFSIISTGLVLGSMYALASLGLTLQWGVLKVLNFAHGSLMTTGAYISWVLLGVLAGNYMFALGGAMLIPFLIGFALYIGLIRPIQGRKSFGNDVWVVTVGISTILENFILIIFGGRYKALPAIVPGYTDILGASINNQHILIMLLSPISLGILMLFLKKTRHGMAVRAVAQENVGAAIVGIKSRNVYAYTVAIGSAFAGLAGVLLGLYYSLSPTMGGSPLLIALFAIVLGGMGSVKGTIYGAYVIGLITSFVSFFLGIFWADPILFIIFMLVIIFKPEGLIKR